MTVPSLIVLMIPGWEIGSASNQNLFHFGDRQFLDQYISSYPSLALAPSEGKNIFQVYQQLGGCDQTSGYQSLPSVLDQYHMDQVVLSDIDRYAAWTRAFHAGVDQPLENEEWNYLSMPGAESLADYPSTTLFSFSEKREELFKRKTNTVFYLSLNSIWSVARTGDMAATKEAVIAVEQTAKQLIQTALHEGLRVLVLSDGGLGLPNTPPGLLPCLLIDKRFEGLKASASDTGNEDVLPTKASGDLSDVAPTILKFMDILPPSQMPGTFLFTELYEQQT